MSRLLEQACGARFGLLDLLRGLLLRFLRRLPGLGLRGVQHLGPLALALAAEALDLGLAVLQLALAPGHLFFGAAQLRGRRALGVALDRVGHLGGGADQVERVHPDRVARRLDSALARGLQDAELNLELGCVASEGLERLAHLVAVVPVARGRKILDARQRRQRGRLRRSSLPFGCHSLAAPRSMTCGKYDCCIGF